MAAENQIPFDHLKHLNHVPAAKIHTMKELGKAGCGISPIAASEPFSLFTEEAIERMRSEVLSEPVMKNCRYSSNLASCQLRGMAPKYAPFSYDAWRSPNVLSIVSEIAGIELVPVMDYEIGHTNILVLSEDDSDQKHKNIDNDDEDAVVDWHLDSYPFVCILMLSACEGASGGGTALRTASGEILKIPRLEKGHAFILQGRHIEHRALRAIGNAVERVTMVTSFRPKDPLVKDETVLATVRAVSDLSALYSGYAEYRLEVLEERVRHELKNLRAQQKTSIGGHARFDTTAFKKWVIQQKDYIGSTLEQLVDEDKVIAGQIEDAHPPASVSALVSDSNIAYVVSDIEDAEDRIETRSMVTKNEGENV